MAGDWIKIEHATIDKPEILRVADLLSVKPNEALGMMVSFWVWLDRNSRNGVVTHMSRSTLDNVTHTPGFAASLVDIGWAEIDDSTGVITITNHDRHNGSPAKTRALGKDRSSRLRTGENVTNPLPEKRREEKTTTKRERLAAPTLEHVELAKRLGIDCDAEWLIYLDHQTNAKHKHTALEAGFRNWLKRAPEFRPKPRRSDAKAAVTAEIWKRERDEPDSRDITGESKRVA